MSEINSAQAPCPHLHTDFFSKLLDRCSDCGSFIASFQGGGEQELLSASEMIDRELVELALESHARALMYPDSKIQHDRANECRNELLKRLTRYQPNQAAAKTHPEDFCHRCGGRNATWFAPSPLWNLAVRAKGEPEILCPVCFIQLAEEAGINGMAWKVAPESYEWASADIKRLAREVMDKLRAPGYFDEELFDHPAFSDEDVISIIESVLTGEKKEEG